MLAPERHAIRRRAIGRDDVHRLLVPLQRGRNREVQRAADDRDRRLAREAVLVAPAADVQRLLRDADLQDVLEFARGECAQVAAVRDHAVGLRLQFLEQPPVVTAREVLEDVGLARVCLHNGDAAVEAGHEIRVDERLLGRPSRVQIVREIRTVQRARRSAARKEFDHGCRILVERCLGRACAQVRPLIAHSATRIISSGSDSIMVGSTTNHGNANRCSWRAVVASVR